MKQRVSVRCFRDNHVNVRRCFGLLVRIEEGGMFPRGYGLSWRDIYTGTAWCAPVPLNWVFALVHEAWLRLRAPRGPGSWDITGLFNETNRLRHEVDLLERELERRDEQRGVGR